MDQHQQMTWLPKSPMSEICLSIVALEALTPATVHYLWIFPKFLNGLCFTILWSLQLSLLLVHLFLQHIFPSTELSINMLGYSALWTDFFSNGLLWLTLLVAGINVRLLDNFQSLPHDCVAYWTRVRDTV